VSQADIESMFIEKIRAAHRKRAEYLYFIYKELCEEVGKAKAQKIIGSALRKAGNYYGKLMSGINTPRDFISLIESGNPKEVFGRETITKSDEVGTFTVSYCPLIDAWQKMGLPEDETLKLCDIAMEADFGITEANQLRLTVNKCLMRGDAVCELQVTK